MRSLVQGISAVALVGTILPSLLYLAGVLDLPTMKQVMFIATIVWFVATPLWMGRTVTPPASQT